jgi:hypothetical protein
MKRLFNLRQQKRISFCALFLITLICLQSGCVFFHGQRFYHLTTRTPLQSKEILVLGFMGGREPWDNDKHIVRRLALRLRALNLPNVYIETIENKKRDLALQLIQNAFDRNRDGQIDVQERASIRLILYGHSFGGAAVVKLARQLKQLNIPVLFTLQVDSVGRGDNLIPSNVARAANLYQRDGLMIKGEKNISAEDASKTTIVANTQFDYGDKKIDISEVSWAKKIFRVAHTRMEYDPAVWVQMEELILNEIERVKKSDEEPGKSQ